MHPIIQSIIGAIIYALAGYGKNKTTEDFDSQKFASTIVIGIVIGILQYRMNLDLEATYGIAVSMGLVAAIENTVKAVYRWLKKRRKKKVISIDEMMDE